MLIEADKVERLNNKVQQSIPDKKENSKNW
jgi:hypothetical protein